MGAPVTLQQTVPTPFTWVVREIAVSCPTASASPGLWQAGMIGPSIPGGTNRFVKFAGGTVSGINTASQWEGRIVVPSGYTLQWTNLLLYTGSTGALDVVVSGYSLG